MTETHAHVTHRNTQQAVEAGEDRSDLMHLVTFRAGGQVYALPVEAILQIIPMMTITPIPSVAGLRESASQALLGVINVRGQIIPVMDLRRHLGLPDARKLYTPIILAASGSRSLGLVADDVVDVIDLPAEAISPLDAIFPDGHGESPVLSGMAHLGDRLAPVLSPDNLFTELLSGEQARSLADFNIPDKNHLPPLYGSPTVPQMLADQPAPLPPEAPAQRPNGSPAESQLPMGQGPYGSPAESQLPMGQGPNGSPAESQLPMGQGPYGSPAESQLPMDQGPDGSTAERTNGKNGRGKKQNGAQRHLPSADPGGEG